MSQGTATLPPAAHGAQVMVKPVGPLCNLDCDYCYYLDKRELYPRQEDFRMTPDCLERFVREYIAMQPGPRVSFAWQGGEPLLMGLDFFRRVVELQKRYLPRGWECANSLQTNGTLLGEDWCAFLKEHEFLIGISIDGPAALHDAYRKDRRGRGTHAAVMRGLALLQRFGVETNALCTVHRANASRPVEVYRFLRENGLDFLQFIPIVEQLGGGRVSPRSVAPKAFGRFLCAIFDEWWASDVGRVYVQIFEESLRMFMGQPSSLCVFRSTCGDALVMEHNGDVFSCDHFVTPEHRLGNISEVSLRELCALPRQRAFGEDKAAGLPGMCRACDVGGLCHGECPRNRFAVTPAGESGLNYLCEGYRRFFRHVRPHMEHMAALLTTGVPVMPRPPGGKGGATHASTARPAPVGRNDPCPCGSGDKYKRCCLLRTGGSSPGGGAGG